MGAGFGWSGEELSGEDRDAAVRALIPAHALGATDPAEAAAVAELVARDPNAAAELASYAGLRGALLFGAPRVNPPPALEARLRAVIQPPPPRVRPVETAASAAPMRGWKRWFAPATRPAWAMAGMALVLLLVTNVWWGLQAGRMAQAQAALQASQASAALARAETGAETATYNRMLAALATGKAQTTMLPADTATAATTGATADTHAMVIWMPGDKSAMVMAQQFPPLKPGNVYQIWLLHGEDRMSGGLFNVDNSGSAMVMVDSPMPLDSIDAVGITQEPAGGSTAPTSTPVVVGAI